MHADMLALHGEFDEALAVLSTGVTQPGHAVCFPMQRAATLLLTGREREVIESTNACVAMHDEHCLRTLTPLLTRRAVAFLRLGHPRRATHSMESAIELISRTGGSLMPFLMIPSADAARLLDWRAASAGRAARIVVMVSTRSPRSSATRSSSRAASALGIIRNGMSDPPVREISSMADSMLCVARRGWPRRRKATARRVRRGVRVRRQCSSCTQTQAFVDP
ncbi:hypothetical protein, partial [Microbacterium testaceum]|uniref:hypothetical protein n=1 Tax=Microbacterium testaceum TaxID=2033 RepID=UPI0019D3DC9A